MFLDENKVEREYASCFEITYQTYAPMKIDERDFMDRA
jgi:hypothetical protein